MAGACELIVGVDPGLRTTGFGVVQVTDGSPALAEAGVVRPDGGAPLEERLRQLRAALAEVLAEYRPRTVVVEDLYSQYAHPRTAILMGHARGVVYLAAAEVGAQVVAYPPALVKRALTGNGAAPKDQVARMVAQLLGLRKPPTPQDVTDALALALCHCVPSRSRSGRVARRSRGLPPALAELIRETAEGSGASR
jgi:crossover junction endodeoxyribonuclease RuvC